MLTVIELLQVAGLLAAALLGRGALVLAVVLILSMPLMAYAYAARAVLGAWHRHDVHLA